MYRLLHQFGCGFYFLLVKTQLEMKIQTSLLDDSQSTQVSWNCSQGFAFGLLGWTGLTSLHYLHYNLPQCYLHRMFLPDDAEKTQISSHIIQTFGPFFAIWHKMTKLTLKALYMAHTDLSTSNREPRKSNHYCYIHCQ